MRLRIRSLHGAMRSSRTEGVNEKKYCSKVIVKSKLPRQPTTAGPKAPSASRVQLEELFMVTHMKLHRQNRSERRRLCPWEWRDCRPLQDHGRLELSCRHSVMHADWLSPQIRDSSKGTVLA